MFYYLVFKEVVFKGMCISCYQKYFSVNKRKNNKSLIGKNNFIESQNIKSRKYINNPIDKLSHFTDEETKSQRLWFNQGNQMSSLKTLGNC